MRKTDFEINGQGLKERWHIGDGKLIQETIQDTDEIIKQNLEFQNTSDGYTPSRDMKHVATVPVIIYDRWVKDSGLKPGSRELGNFISKKLNNPEFLAFRTGLGTIGVK